MVGRCGEMEEGVGLEDEGRCCLVIKPWYPDIGLTGLKSVYSKVVQRFNKTIQINQFKLSYTQPSTPLSLDSHNPILQC